MPTLLLSQRELKSILSECIDLIGQGREPDKAVSSVIKKHKDCLLAEMAFKKKVYMEKIDNLLPQIIENWCLVRHCVLTGKTNNLVHWSNELIGHLYTVCRLHMKDNAKFEDHRKAILQVWYNNDYDQARTIAFVIQWKFNKEKFEVSGPVFNTICQDMVNAQDDIVNIIAAGDLTKVVPYVESLKTIS